MSYINIYDVLPKEIVEQIQEYVDGVKVYIPKKADNHKSWGSNTDTKQLVSSRNHQIRLEHQNGLTVSELAQKKLYRKLYIHDNRLNNTKAPKLLIAYGASSFAKQEGGINIQP